MIPVLKENTPNILCSSEDNGGYHPYNLFDGDYNTAFANSANGGYMGYMFDGIRYVERIEILVDASAGMAQNCTVYYTENGTDWEALGTYSLPIKSPRFNSIEIRKSIRGFRVRALNRVDGRTESYVGVQFYEMQAYGY